MAIISAVAVVLWPSHRKQLTLPPSQRRSLGGLEVGAGASAQLASREQIWTRKKGPEHTESQKGPDLLLWLSLRFTLSGGGGRSRLAAD